MPVPLFNENEEWNHYSTSCYSDRNPRHRDGSRGVLRRYQQRSARNINNHVNIDFNRHVRLDGDVCLDIDRGVHGDLCVHAHDDRVFDEHLSIDFSRDTLHLHL